MTLHSPRPCHGIAGPRIGNASLAARPRQHLGGRDVPPARCSRFDRGIDDRERLAAVVGRELALAAPGDRPGEDLELLAEHVAAWNVDADTLARRLAQRVAVERRADVQ